MFRVSAVSLYLIHSRYRLTLLYFMKYLCNANTGAHWPGSSMWGITILLSAGVVGTDLRIQSGSQHRVVVEDFSSILYLWPAPGMENSKSAFPPERPSSSYSRTRLPALSRARFGGGFPFVGFRSPHFVRRY